MQDKRNATALLAIKGLEKTITIILRKQLLAYSFDYMKALILLISNLVNLI
jgi:hypothetical protein